MRAGAASLAYGTLLGGGGWDQGHAVAVAGSVAYIAGKAASQDFPVRDAAQGAKGGATYEDYDAFVAALDTAATGDPSLLWATYLGGGDFDVAAGIAADGAGGVYVAGSTASTDFPTLAPYQAAHHGGDSEAFVARYVGTTGARAWATYLGGSGYDEARALAVDGHGRAHVAGFTKSTDFPVADPPLPGRPADGCGGAPCADAFVTALTASGAGLTYSTYLGGTGDDYGNGLALDPAGAAYVAGQTTSGDFPTTPGSYDPTKNPLDDMFITKIAAAALPPLPSSDMTFTYDPLGRLLSVQPTTADTGQPVAAATTPGQAASQTDRDSPWSAFGAAFSGWLGHSSLSWMMGDAFDGRTFSLWVAALAVFPLVLLVLGPGRQFARSHRRRIGVQRARSAYSRRPLAIVILVLAIVAAPPQPMLLPLIGLILALGLVVLGHWVLHGVVHSFRLDRVLAPLGRVSLSGSSLCMRRADTILVLLLLIALCVGGAAWLPRGAGWGVGAAPVPAPYQERAPHNLVFSGDASKMLAVGQQHNLVLKEDGSLWTWGLNAYGQLGYGPANTYMRYPKQVPFASRIKAVGAGENHSLAVAQDGTVWAWGRNDYGQLGNNTVSPYTAAQTTPLQVSGLTDVVAVAGGTNSSMALTASGTVYAWRSGSLGNTCTTNCQRLVPTLISNLTGVIAIAAGRSHALALKSDGTVWSWGTPFRGAGLGTLGYDGSQTPVPAVGLSGVIAISASTNYSVAVKSDGTVWNWGEDEGNQLGRAYDPACHSLNPPNDCGTPRQVTTLSGMAGVTAGRYFSLARGSDGSVWAWGAGFLGEQGSGTQQDQTTPARVVGAGGVGLFDGSIAVAAGNHSQHALAMRTDGDLWAWGVNRVGELTGDGPDVCQPEDDPPWAVYTRCSLAPIPVSNLNARGEPYDVLHHCAPSTPWVAHAGAGVCITAGTFVTQQTDLVIPTDDAPLDFTRTYHSADPTDVGFGPGWSFPYAMRVTQEPEGSRIVRMPDGRRDRYTTTDNVTFTAPPGVYHRLTAAGGGGYTLRSPGQVLYHFAANGQLSSIVDRNNTTTTFTWSGSGLVVADPTGQRTLTLTYGTGANSGRFMSLAESIPANAPYPLARSVQYAYDAKGDLIKVTDTRGGLTTMTYDSGHRLLTVIDPNGQATQRKRLENVYDPAGRVDEQYDAKRERWQYAYDTTQRKTTLTDRRGNDTIFDYDAEWRARGGTDPEGNTVSFDYDAGNYNLGGVTDGRGHATQFDDYDARGNPQTVDTPLEYSTTMTYNERNDPKTVTVPVADGITRTTTFGYDDNGNLKTVSKPLGDVTTFTYNPLNGDLVEIKDARNVVTTIDYDIYGYPRTVMDGLNHTWTYEYDAGGRLRKVVSPLGNSLAEPPGNFTTSFDYNEANQVTEMRVTLTEDQILKTLKTIYEYDANGNLKKVIDPNNLATRFEYDVNDNLKKVIDSRDKQTQHEYDENDNRTSTTDATARKTTWTYDKADRLVKIADHAGNFMSFQLDGAGNVEYLTDPRGHTTQYHYDNANQLTWVRDPLNYYTCYDYYRDGQLKRVNDAPSTEACTNQVTAPRATSFKYDEAGRFQERTDPLGRTWGATYFPNGLLKTEKDGNNHTTTYTYDGANRLEQVAYFDSTTVGYLYDAADRLTSVTDPTGQTTYGYDGADRLTSVSSPGTGTVGYKYDPAGRRILLTHPSSHAVTIAYNDVNHTETITDWLSQATTYSYDDAGRLAGIAAPNGVSSSYGYDTAGRLGTIAHTKGGATLASFIYDRDAAGNVERLREIGGSGATPASYTYDPTGNRTSVTTNGVTKHAAYDAANQLCWDGGATAGACAVPTSGATTYAHDQNGNRIGKTAGGVTTTYGYNAANLLTSVTTGGATTATYGYDGDGYRVSQTAGGTTTPFAWDRLGAGGLGTVIGDGGGENVFGPAGLQQRTVGTSSQYAHGDGLGSVRLVTNAAGQAAGGATYEPWGVPKVGGTGLGGFGFTGEQADAATGLVDLRARTYDPATGRFLQLDPLGLGGGSANYYPYAANNPANYVDPSGKLIFLALPWAVWAAVGIAGAALVGVGLTSANCQANLSCGQGIADFWGGVLSSPAAGDLGRTCINWRIFPPCSG